VLEHPGAGDHHCEKKTGIVEARFMKLREFINRVEKEGTDENFNFDVPFADYPGTLKKHVETFINLIFEYLWPQGEHEKEDQAKAEGEPHGQNQEGGLYEIFPGTSLELRWVDLIHRPPDSLVPFSGLKRGFHRGHKPVRKPDVDMTAAWEWFELRAFSLATLLLLDAEAPRSFVVHTGIKESIIQEWGATLSIEKGVEAALGIVSNARDAGRTIEESLEAAAKDEDVKTDANRLLEGLNIPDDNQCAPGAAAYVVLPAIYEKDVIDEKALFYFYLPGLTGKQSVLTATVVAVAVPRVHLEQTIIKMTVNRLVLFSQVVGLWARYVHEAEVRRLHRYLARRSAAAGIIARNMSHNLGSHVIHRSSVAALRQRIAALYGNLLLDNEIGMVEKIKDRLDEYLQKKADFVAEVTTEPLMSTRSALFYQEVMLWFQRNTGLLDSIARNEGYGYEAWIHSSLQVRCFTVPHGDEVEATHLFPAWRRKDGDPLRSNEPGTVPFAERILDEESEDLELIGLNGQGTDLRVAWPGPLGEYALYGMLENIIRNAAKHSGKNPTEEDPEPLLITLVVRDEDPFADHFKAYLFDNVTDVTRPVSAVIDDERIDATLGVVLGKYLECGLIDNSGQCRPEAWGLKEIMIGANLLAGSTEFVWSRKNLAVQPQDDPNEEETFRPWEGQPEPRGLMYRFLLMKAREAVFIGAAFSDAVKDDRVLRAAGMRVFASFDDFEKQMNACGGSAAAFQFAVLDEKQKIPEAAKGLLPFRIIRVVAGSGQVRGNDGEVLTPENPLLHYAIDEDSLRAWLWNTWLRRWLPESEDTCSLVVILDEIHAKEWANALKRFPSAAPETDKFTVQALAAGDDGKAVIGKRQVIYDRHGLFVRKCGEGPLPKEASYSIFDKLSPDFLSISQPPGMHGEADAPWLFPFELIEAGLLRMVVVDERLAAKAMEPLDLGEKEHHDRVARTLIPDPGGEDSRPLDPQRPRFWHAAERAGVQLVTHLDFDSSSPTVTPETLREKGFFPWTLDEPSATAAAEERTGWAANPSGRRSPTCPSLRLVVRSHNADDKEAQVQLVCDRRGDGIGGFAEEVPLDTVDLILVHQGILDSIASKASSDVAKMFENALKSSFGWYVVESGRGVPPNVQKAQVKFLPFSLLDKTLFGGRVAKLRLVRMLMELTRRPRNG
jgi:hypothetical protein